MNPHLSVFRHLPLRGRIPDRLHAVSVSLPKGPSFGMKNSLILPLFYFAHYDLVKDAAGRAALAAGGIDPDLLRLSIGREPVDDIIASLAEALEA